ncbi:MAG TPA: YpdA family putative bacillithiol disulfide reductase [Acidobacteriota bacterium]|nr:YpdA family putative bacillithiol disulfide reductase [Acidobacteriota bacterium]HRV08452.1 YpdA family putative bacillithiol disulfide reductase [Acidobacteriota bacterium]
MSTHAKYDLIIVGAGPSGLACAIYARKAGLDTLVVEKGCVINSIYHFPENMTFFTTAELLEIGDIPMTVAREKPRRIDALKYYRRVAEFYGLNIRDYEKVVDIAGEDMNFRVRTRDRFQDEAVYATRKVVIATGYYDNPNLLGVPGEDLPKVTHYYRDPHPYYAKDCLVVGGKNSAAIVALELYRNGARVTLVHRGREMGHEVKYWIRPDIENRIQNGEILAYFSSRVREIRLREVLVETPEGIVTLPNDFVFAMTGYHPDPTLLRLAGVEVEARTFAPRHDPDTLETNVPGVYVAGSVVSGLETNRIFIENGRFHGERIIPHIISRLAEWKSQGSGDGTGG